MRTLYLLRHGEALPRRTDGSDHDRELAAVGRRDSERAGARIAALPDPPTLLLCSSARRAVETLDALRPALAGPAEVRCERELYMAGGDRILERVSEVDDRHAAVLVVAHNPGIGTIAHALARPSADADYTRLQRGFPAGALAVLRFDVGRWLDVVPGRGRLVELTTPAPRASIR